MLKNADVDIALDAHERYFLFCERLRAELTGPRTDGGGQRRFFTGGGSGQTSLYDRSPYLGIAAHGSRGEPTRVEECWQSLRRMMADGDVRTNHESAVQGVRSLESDEAIYPFCFYARMVGSHHSVSSPIAGDGPQNGSSSSHIDGDRLAQRLASQIRQRTHERDAQKRAAARAAEETALYNGARIAPYADAKLESQLAQLHHETTSLVLHVRRANRQSAELRERLTHSKWLLERSRALQKREPAAQS